MASATAVAVATPAPHVFRSSIADVTSHPHVPSKAVAQTPSAPQPYEQLAPIDPLLAQAEELEHALIRARFHSSLGSTDPFAHLRKPIETTPTTPYVQEERRPSSAFRNLPTEIHIELARWLPWPSQWSLKRTNKYFHSIPELAAPVSFFHQRHRGKAYQQALLIALCSGGIVRRGYEPCYACRRFRWKTKFEIAQYQRGFLWCDGGEDPLAYGARIWGDDSKDGSVYENGKFCIDCGVKAGKYAVGDMVDVVQEWSDYHSDRQSVSVAEPPPYRESGEELLQEERRSSGTMISMQGEEDMERKFNECGRFGCSGRGCTTKRGCGKKGL